MSKKEYLRKLSKKLSALPGEERRKALSYYEELIDDRVEVGYTEEAATAELGEVRYVADDIIRDAKERGVKMRFTGGWAIVGALCGIACGVALLFLISQIISNYDGRIAPFFDRAGGEWVEHTGEYKLAEGDGLIVDIRDQDLFIGVSEDDKAHVTYYENDVTKFTAEKTEGSLVLKQYNEKWHWLFFWKKPRQAVILLPQSFTGDIAAKVTTGEVRVDTLEIPGGVGLTTSTGDIIMYDVSANMIVTSQSTGDLIIGRCVSAEDVICVTSTGDIDIEQTSTANGEFNVTSSTGDIKLSECSAHSVAVSLTTGEIKFASITADSVLVKSTTGDMEIEGVNANSLEAKATTGDVKLTSIAAVSVSARATTGSIHVSDIEAKALSFKTTTGSIHGTLCGSIKDYTITSHTTTGGNNLPQELKLGDRQLSAEATTGSIHIAFAED